MKWMNVNTWGYMEHKVIVLYHSMNDMVWSCSYHYCIAQSERRRSLPSVRPGIWTQFDYASPHFGLCMDSIQVYSERNQWIGNYISRTRVFPNKNSTTCLCLPSKRSALFIRAERFDRLIQIQIQMHRKEWLGRRICLGGGGKGRLHVP